MESYGKSSNENIHNLSLTDRKLLTVEGVINLDNYDVTYVLLDIVGGTLEIKGEGLNIRQLSLEQKQVVVEGTVNALIYGKENAGKRHRNLLRKIIK